MHTVACFRGLLQKSKIRKDATVLASLLVLNVKRPSTRLGQARVLSKIFRLLRLMATDVILRYGSNRTDLQTDMDHADHVRELSDEYVFRAVSLWLVTTYGSLVCPDAIRTELEQGAELLSKTLSEFNEYPFANLVPDQSFKDFNQGAKRLLNGWNNEVELIGELYEHIQKFPSHIDCDGAVDIPTNIQDRDKRRLVGQFYTPSSIVDYCFERALDATKDKFIIALKSKVQTSCNADEQPISDGSWQSTRILDPSCGTGNFLLGAVRMGRQVFSGLELLSFVGNFIYGYELDARAACLARLSVILSTVDLWYTDETGHVLRSLLKRLRRNIVNSDTLFEAPYELEVDSLNEVGSSREAGASNYVGAVSKFGIVITNPPYVSFGARNQPKLSATADAYLRSKFPNSADYKIRVHSIFQELALRYTAQNGVATLLVPDGFLTGGYYKNLRQTILSHSRIHSLVELPVDTVPGAVVGRWCAATYIRSDNASSDYPVKLFSHMQNPTLQYELSKSLLVSKDQNRFRLIFNDIDTRLVALIDKLAPLSSEFSGHAGIRALNGQRSIISNNPDGPLFRRAIVTGLSVLPHVVTWDGAWINIDPKLLYKGGFNRSIVESPKLLLRQTGDCVIAGLDDQNFYHLNNIHSVTKCAHSLRELDFLDGLMNSKFWKYIYRLKTREEGRALAQIDIEILESMPLPVHNLQIEKQIAELIRMYRRCHVNSKKLLCQQIEHAIDILVYEMFELDQLMMQQIDGSCGTLTSSLVTFPTAEQLLTSPSLVETDEVLCGFHSR